MSILASYVFGRERILNWILGIQPEFTLNPPGVSHKSSSRGATIAGDIKDSLNQIMSLAITEKGKVDYGKLVQDPLYRTFRELVGGLQNFDFQILRSRNEKLAFWINLYNALVIDAVIQEKIRESVTESRLGVLAFFQKAAYQVNSQRFSLTDIEHGVLRGNRGFPYFPTPHFGPPDARLKAVIQPIDPRIHFALNCASNSCPPIAVYTPEELDDQFNLAARNFINNDIFPDLNKNVISISKIFHWYQVDFGGKVGILEFLGRFVEDDHIKDWLSENQSTIQIKYHPYDWGLNKIKD